MRFSFRTHNDWNVWRICAACEEPIIINTMMIEDTQPPPVAWHQECVPPFIRSSMIAENVRTSGETE